jgi:hypothetical protein
MTTEREKRKDDREGRRKDDREGVGRMTERE